MFARLWWKEARQTWPVWSILALAGFLMQWCLFLVWSSKVSTVGYSQVGMVVSLLYLFLITAAVFAGERENGTQWILDALPADRLRVWVAKAIFAMSTALGLGALLWLTSLVFGRDAEGWLAMGVITLVWGLAALGWGLFWSVIARHALSAAFLAIASLCVTLLAFMSLDKAPTLAAAPLLLTVTALTSAGSALAFRASGPPRWAPRRARLVPPTLSNAAQGSESASPKPVRFWSAAIVPLAWQTLRLMRAELCTLLALACAFGLAPHVFMWNNGPHKEAIPLVNLGMALLAVVTGVLTFQTENRARTNRFLLQHGARPGVVWATKIALWWGLSLLLWAVCFAPVWLIWRSERQPASFGPIYSSPLSTIGWELSGLTLVFGIAAVCGMALRTGILAGLIALLAALVVWVPLAWLLSAQVLFPWYWAWLALGILAAGWAWCGDWLRDTCGWPRWGRLGLFTLAVPAVFLPFYMGCRVWGVPKASVGSGASTLIRARTATTVATADNAAALYCEAYRLMPSQLHAGEAAVTDPNVIAMLNQAPDARWGTRQFFEKGEPYKPSARLSDWLNQIEPALKKLREGAQRSACLYFDPGNATIFDKSSTEPPYSSLALPLAISARVRLAQGDLRGSWTELETLARMARQYSYASISESHTIDSLASRLILAWAADPRQSESSLRDAATSWRSLPRGASPVDQIALQRTLYQNSLDLPQNILTALLAEFPGDPKRKATSADFLRSRIQTTPWEIARTRRAYDLLAVAAVEFLKTGSPALQPNLQSFPESSDWPNIVGDPTQHLTVETELGSVTLEPEDIRWLYLTTPLLDHVRFELDGWRVRRQEANHKAVWLVLLLRIYQTSHDGKLPESIDQILSIHRGTQDPLYSAAADGLDPYSRKPFGYVQSHGQWLLPIGAIDGPSWGDGVNSDELSQSTAGYWLLYCRGPDHVDNGAMQNLSARGVGDLIYPLRDNVPPPTESP